MENQFYHSYKNNEIVKVTKIVKNHIFYKCVPKTLMYSINLDISLQCCNEDEYYYRLDFNLVNDSNENKLTIRQFNKAFEILDLRREKGEDFKDIDDIEFIENNEIYCNEYTCNRFLKDKIYFENEKEAELYENIRKYYHYLTNIEEFPKSAYNINIWAHQLAVHNNYIYYFINKNKEIDLYKIIYIIEKHNLLCKFEKYKEIILDNVTRKR
jgi:hypothetical protein